MGHNEKEKIMNLFFEETNREFHIREIARLTQIPKTTVERKIKELASEKMIFRKKEGIFPSYKANETNFFYVYTKKNFIISKIYSSGLIDYLETNLFPKCIILFGSCAKGEYSKESDIDIFVQAQEKSIVLEKYEKALNHKINIFFEANIPNLSGELLNNLVNGYKLRGYLKINK